MNPPTCSCSAFQRLKKPGKNLVPHVPQKCRICIQKTYENRVLSLDNGISAEYGGSVPNSLLQSWYKSTTLSFRLGARKSVKLPIFALPEAHIRPF